MQKKHRQSSFKGSNTNLIVGRRSVLEALEAAVPIEKILLSNSLQHFDGLDRLIYISDKKGIKIEHLDRQKIDNLAHGLNHQGVIAKTKPYEYSSVGEIMSSCQDDKAALVIILDHITDVGNFGAIVRTAEVLGASGIIIAQKRSVDVVALSYKTSAGAVARMKIAKVANISNMIDRLQENGFWIAGACERANNTCWESPFYGKIGLVMGSEGKGISRLVASKCDFLVGLPQRGEIGSLNVSCATAALGYEWLRQSMQKGLFTKDGEE